MSQEFIIGSKHLTKHPTAVSKSVSNLQAYQAHIKNYLAGSIKPCPHCGMIAVASQNILGSMLLAISCPHCEVSMLSHESSPSSFNALRLKWNAWALGSKKK